MPTLFDYQQTHHRSIEMGLRAARITTTGPGDGQRSFASVMASGVVDATASPQVAYDFHALYIGVSGNVTIQHKTGGTAVQYTNVPVGFFPVAGVAVTAATTATGIVWCKW